MFAAAPKATPKPAKTEKDTAVAPPKKKRPSKAPNPQNLNRKDLVAWQDFIGSDD
jgi:hypothetical protein